jgi:hypothetical protein
MLCVARAYESGMSEVPSARSPFIHQLAAERLLRVSLGTSAFCSGRRGGCVSR